MTTTTLDRTLMADQPMARERAKVKRKPRYGFLWVTSAFFFLSLAGHWLFAWPVFVDDQRALGQDVDVKLFVYQTTRDMLENWQSEFLQLIWQVAGLAWLLHIGSPQSREGGDRKEEKLDLIIRKLYPDDAQRIFSELNDAYPRP